MHKIACYMFRHSVGGDFVHLLCTYCSAYKIEFKSWILWEFRCRMWSSKYATFAFSVILKVWRSFAVTLCYVTTCSVWHVVIAMYCYDHRHLFCVAQLLARWRCWKRLLASSCLSVRPHRTTRLPLDGFSRNLIFEYFSKSFEKIQVSLKSNKNGGYFTWAQFTFLIIFAQFFLEFKMYQSKVVVKIKKDTFLVQ